MGYLSSCYWFMYFTAEEFYLKIICNSYEEEQILEYVVLVIPGFINSDLATKDGN